MSDKEEKKGIFGKVEENGESLFVLRGFKRPLQTVDFLADGRKLLVGELHVNHFQEYTLDENFLPVDELDIEMEIGRDYSEYYENMVLLRNDSLNIVDIDSLFDNSDFLPWFEEKMREESE